MEEVRAEGSVLKKQWKDSDCNLKLSHTSVTKRMMKEIIQNGIPPEASAQAWTITSAAELVVEHRSL